MKNRFGINMVMICLFVTMSVAAHAIGGGELTYTPGNALPVVFSHELHVNIKGFQCTRCHYDIFQMVRGAYKMDMSSLAKGEFCGRCHNGGDAFNVTDKNNCTRCHR